MKLVSKLIGFAAIIAAITLALSLTACDSGTTLDSELPKSTVVNIAAIQGVTPPATGGTPVAAITENAQYSGTVTWSPAVSETFAAATAYTATITLTAKTGYTLQGVAADFFSVAGATASNSANSGVITAVFPSTGTVNKAAIEGVNAPVIGGTPVKTITNEQYTGTVTWSPDDSTFAAGTVYTATITLTEEDRYTLQGVAVDFFTVEGATSVNYDADTGVITVVFQQTAAVINIAAIEGVDAPATGETPVTVINATQYTGTVTWSPDDSTFAAETEYTATITLTAKDGFTLQDVAADFFTVAGATTVSYDADTGVITAVFPQTAAVIDIAAIEGVTAPVTGATPVTAITETAQYTGTVRWNGSPETFAATTVYTATITLTAKTGYTLQGVGANFFTVAGATASNSANSGVITAVFPETAGMSNGIEMVSVPGGSFQMGGTYGNPIVPATPVHTVTLTGFSMSKYQVTQAQYQAVMGTNPSGFNSDPADGEVQENRPVETITWYDAIEFCNALSIQEGLSPYYAIDKDNKDPNNTSGADTYKWTITLNSAADGYRLPTEAQWEYAARGGDPLAPGWTAYSYSGSNTRDDVAWTYYNSGSKTHEVGKKAPNGLGIYDMTGNVYEWCWDWTGAYTSEDQTNPVGPASGQWRMIRGGSWDQANSSDADWLSIFRLMGNITSGRSILGLRLVRP